MIKPLSFFIGLRYTRAKRRSHFVSFISLASVIGIALGVMVLITVLSVMNGFSSVVNEKFFAVAPQVNVMTNVAFPVAEKKLRQVIKEIPDIVAFAPYVSGQGMLSIAGEVSAAQVQGIDPAQEVKISKLASKMVKGKFSSISPGSFNVLLGVDLARSLGVDLGDRVTLYTTETSVTPLGILPRYRRLTVSGIFATHSGFGFDSSVAYINLQDAEKLFRVQKFGRTGFHLKLSDMYLAKPVTEALASRLPADYLVTNWTSRFGSLFKALAMQKTIMFVILLLIVAIAAFNLIVTLVMVVNEKRSDIAILRTLGAQRRTVMWVFIYQGAIVGAVGTIVGLVLGILLALNITDLVNWIQHTFHVQWVSSQVYWVNYLPSKLRAMDVVQVSCIAWVLSVLATLYPASLAFRLQPAEALRYE